jgi:hypothetical protein
MYTCAVPCWLFLLATESLVASTAHITQATLLSQFDDEHLHPKDRTFSQATSPAVTLGLQAFQRDLVAAGYTVDGVAGVLGVTAADFMGGQWRYDRHMVDRVTAASTRSDESSMLALLVRLFLFNEQVSLSLLRPPNPSLLSDAAFGAVNALKLWFSNWSTGEQLVRFALQLYPVSPDLIMATDNGNLFRHNTSHHPVMYIGIDSHALVHAAPPPLAHSAILDVCTGSGVQAIAMLRRCPSGCHALLVDINPRAVRCALILYLYCLYYCCTHTVLILYTYCTLGSRGST